MKKKSIFLQFTLVVLYYLLNTVETKAQIEDIKVGTTTRKMLAYAPSTITKNQPLLISMHGLNQDIAYQKNQAQWEKVADVNNFVVVYPAGINNSWDLGGTSDTDFILAIIEEMYKRYGIDKNRVYLSGFSMGGMMTYHAANVIADKIAAFAPVSGYLMGGPNTNSKRSIPLIHTHGTSDDVVPFSGVQPCLNAWITRNGCPTTEVLTKPYPSNKPNSNGSKYYWGTGIDGVSVVLLRIEGSGHWHSNNTAGIMTSEEIWNFCKNYALDYGVPKFVSATVNEDNPKQIKIELSKAIADSVNFKGFSLKIDNQSVAIESIVLVDTARIAINLTDSIKNDNEITFSYSNGNVYSKLVRPLAELNNVFVDNLLKGSSPRFIEAYTSENGDTLYTKFNKKMVYPKDISTFLLKAVYSDTTQISFNQFAYYKNDSTCLWFSLSQKVYADYKLILFYSGNTIKASDSSSLKTFSNFEVTNNAKGLPVQIQTAKVDDDGINITLTFSKPMALSATQLKYFSVKSNNAIVLMKSGTAAGNAIKITLSSGIHNGDAVTITYSPGDVKSTDKGVLTGFNAYAVLNTMSVPVWNEIPANIEAENYYLQYGVQTENTGDTGGGLNVGWIETGDWMEYAINNTTTSTAFEITFRLASINANTRIDYYLNNTKISAVTVPNTGNWQTYQSVNANITIPAGKHYLKLVGGVGGFNINYMDIKVKPNSINKLSSDKINIYPNPTSNKIFIQSGTFLFTKIEIINLLGKTIYSDNIFNSNEIQLPSYIEDGIYFIKLCNNEQFRLEKIVVRK